MSNLKHNMAHLYHIIADSKPMKPSNRGSGLGENELSVSLGATSLSETPRSAGDPGPEQQKKKKKKVVVVGAGISGLRCAAVLQRHGIEVVVLEGRDRIGGRIHTTRSEKGVRDIGAAWLHETSQNKLVKLISKLNIEYYYDDGLPLYYTEQGRAGSQFKAKKVADEFADHCEWFYETYPDAPDQSVSDFVNTFVQNHELITRDEKMWAPQAVKEVELWLGTATELASSKHLSYFITERNLYMRGGYDGIVLWTAESLLKDAGTICLNHVVDRIMWSEDGAKKSTVEGHDSNGEAFSVEADAVVSTLPLGVLRHELVSFEPSLPDDVLTGLRGFSYGALGKVFFEFADVFWSKDNDQFMFYPNPPALDEDLYGTSASSDSSSGIETILNYATVTINLWIMTGAKELCVQIAEPLTQRIEAMTDKKEIYRFFEPLFKLLRTEPYKTLPKLLNVESTHWTQDSMAGFGSYSADKVGDEPERLIEALENRKGSHLQFAGEHCTMVANGCVHGAFATGETAAKNLLNSFGVEYDGGDLVSLT
ncbi:Polyamine oxidase FMS1 [Fulvia fulva]|uniref:Polyamine oxidase FMS1 n=1 Tax=Passalora fulva TaxID=5499 RepID=A0A9Q8PG42_PASFU|nr:Polyamine oxidase FMS1 [Fulvia fulva]KAK4614065.1 Polyamine oxidase FMS1 [Fulvia fulva]KAK4614865.1 Polyamine oxidase FMS1 [Fulvia fulva]UJO21796.1 Polyamine oxidase FMS1 [Fulvia fulva]WPV20411.1 Polyamine oxidase FMS1 [Fulvia fulva]WPV35628.1 Polyamine oxidase FMS1 [Fulvia fulva]